MKLRNRKITTAAAGLVLAAGLAGCSLFPSPRPPVPLPATPTSMLPASCPFLAPEEVRPVRIPQGTPKEAIGGVLNSYGAWLNAGSETLSTWQAGGTVPRECVDSLAAANAEAYSTTIFTSHSDVAWQQYFSAVERMNAQTLQGVRDATEGQGSRGTFELLKEIDSSSTENGTFLKFDAVYKPSAGTPAGATWEEWDKPTRWYVELIPDGDFLVINYVEQTLAAGYP
ncbi:hypothetical protein [Arthrobacter sp. S39]|uniref:hypothetical protein n=1 Tax=Arthrobacter sp. S39 TaxID=2509720 RepID=UPI00103729ED|nr:hypothetical protein [Arthrobacter sp. S39]TAP41895.1 hypothetical protein EYS21_17355 [Arthrobacter sp. S39]